MNTPPPGIPPKLLLVILPTGERHFVDREMIGGVAKWASGSNVTVVEYLFSAVVYVPSKQPARAEPKAKAREEKP